MNLMLGSVQFTLDELPERISLGGSQEVAVRKYAGGEIDVQTLGAFDDVISWSGVLWFTDALSRAKAINDIRMAGKPVTLQVGTQSVQVVVTRFKYDYENDFYIPYSIDMQPMGVLAVPTASNPVTKTPTVAVSAPAVTTKPQLAATPMTLASIASSGGKVNPPKYNVASLFGLGAQTPLGQIINAMSPAGVGGIVSTVHQVVYLAKVGESLWSIATKHYGNGSLWTKIAAANNLARPGIIAAGQRLFIPNPTRTVDK